MSGLLIQSIADDLLGEVLNGWSLVEKVVQTDNNTGGRFSVGYYGVSQEGKRVFVKVMDYVSAFNEPDPPRALNAMTEAYLFEVDLLKLCRERSMKYVVRILDEGTITLRGQSISFIVLEKAEASARNMLDVSRFIDFAWCLRSLHNVAVAIESLHKEDIAHQDIKPSNVVLFNDNKLSKLGDFGRSSKYGKDMPHDQFPAAGDKNHSAFELLYKQIDSDWRVRRYGCDMFMLGDLIMSYFNNVSIVSATLRELQSDFKPQNWTGTYDEVKPYIIHAFNIAIERFNEKLPKALRQDLQKLVSELCNPNLEKRGDTRYSDLRRLSLEKYISRLNLLAERFEFDLRRMVTNEQI